MDVFIYKVIGKSMYPTIQEGDVIFINRRLKNELKLGDIIVYGSGVCEDKFIVHRLIWKKKMTFVTKGDNIKERGWVNKIDVAGKVCGVYRENRKIEYERFNKRFHYLALGFIESLKFKMKRIGKICAEMRYGI